MSADLFSRTLYYRAKARSQAFVEFAMVLPIFLTLMCGVIDYGFMIGNSMAVAMAAREGANAGARTLNDPLNAGVLAAVNAAKPRILLYSKSGGAIITKVVYLPNLSTTYAYFYDRVNPTNSCVSTGLIYGGGDSLKNKSRLLSGPVTNATFWQLPVRRLPFSPSVLDATNQSMIAMEIFYTNSFVTPIGTLIGMVTPNVLYDATFF